MNLAKHIVRISAYSLVFTQLSGEAPAQTYVQPELVCAASASMSGAHMAKKTGYIDAIAEIVQAGDDFRRVLYTGQNLQLVIMTLQPSEASGAEVSTNHDIFVRIEVGTGEISIDGSVTSVGNTSAIVIPAGVLYRINNSGSTPMRMFIVYGQPEFASNSVRKTKAEADSVPDNFDGCTTE